MIHHEIKVYKSQTSLMKHLHEMSFTIFSSNSKTLHKTLCEKITFIGIDMHSLIHNYQLQMGTNIYIFIEYHVLFAINADKIAQQ